MFARSVFVLSIDPALGRIDKHSLSQQTLMELFIENIEYREFICGSEESPSEIEYWAYVKINDANEVVKINWCRLALEGSVCLEYLPLTTRDVSITCNELSGTVDLTSLPDGLEQLDLSGNQFEGTVDLTQLPLVMLKLYICRNNFCGKTDFSQLPESLIFLSVSNTYLEGEICAFDGALETYNSRVKDLRKW